MGNGVAAVSATRARSGQKNTAPALLIGDSMCAKNTDTADKETKGYCWYKSTNGIKRHLLVDVLGNVYFVHCTPANVSDDDALIELIRQNQRYFLSLPPAHPVTLLLDNGYHKDYLEQQLEQIEPGLRQRIKIELSTKPTRQQRAAAKRANPAKHGFVVVHKRWIVERTNAWINQCRALWKMHWAYP